MKIAQLGVCGLVWLGMGTSPAFAAAPAPTPTLPAALPLETYGHLPSVDLIALSPDGTMFALLTANAQGQQLQVRTVADSKVIALASTGKAKLRSLQWAGDHHLLITRSATAEVYGLTGPKREFYMVLDYNLDTGKLHPLLDGKTGDGVSKLNTVSAMPISRMIDGKPVAFLVGTTFASNQGVRTLFRVELDKNRTRQLVVGTGNTSEWLIDQAGEIEARVDYTESTGHWLLWTRRGKTLVRSLESTDAVDSPWLEGFGRTADTVMVGQREDDESSYLEITLGEDHASAPVADYSVSR